MSIYHCSIKIISRSGGRSAVSAAAYRAGECLYNEETGITHDFDRKGGVVMSEILLPEYAPAEFLDRQRLWNEVQKMETRSDARLAREVEVALPIEMDRDEQIECVRKFISENFTSKGMIADWALHDKDDGNPHAHILLTCRGFNSDHEWDHKMKSVFANDRDAHGRAIYNPDKPSYNPKDKENTSQYRIPQLDENGEQKLRERPGKGREMLGERINVPANDWNDRTNIEIWRKSWADNCNQYLDLDHQIDHRSYERQSIDRVPTIHEGFTARKIESAGGVSERMQINREIRESNNLRDQLTQIVNEITDLITQKARDIYDRCRKTIRDACNARSAGRDARTPGRDADADRKSERTDSGTYRAEGRIDDIKRGTAQAYRTIQSCATQIRRTDSEIEGTDQGINELKESIIQKERDQNDRIEKLKERRASHYDGRDAGRDRGSEIGEREPSNQIGAGVIKEERDRLRSTADDIRSFLDGINAEEKSARAEARNSRAQREKREAEQQRLAAERSKEIERSSRRRYAHSLDIGHGR